MADKIFELNGKAYDALTGAYLGDAKRVPHTATVQAMQPKAAPHQQRRQAVSIDGIITSKPARTAAAAKHASAVNVHQRTQPTKTLMRHAVSRPAKPQSAHTAAMQSAVKPAQSALQPAHDITPKVATKLSSNVVDPMRARRARDAGRSQSVQHFKPAVTDLRRQYGNAISTQPSARPIAAQAHPSTPAATAVTVRPTRQDDEAYEQDLFAEALAHATSHEQKAPKEPAMQAIRRTARKRRQLLGIAASLSVFMLLFGFIALQNRDNIRLQMASAKAGFSAAVPLNKPAGYDMQKLSYAPGNVAMQYSTDTNQGFTITQKKSNWDSQTLLENFVATSNEDYKGYQSNGRTVYVYGKGQATWVNGGIWYQIKDASGLTNEQLVRIAASM